MKYNVLKFTTNTADQYSATVAATFDNNLKGAKVNYHQVSASLQNADDVAYAVVIIVDEYGNPLDGYREVIDNRVEVEPEPEGE